MKARPFAAVLLVAGLALVLHLGTVPASGPLRADRLHPPLPLLHPTEGPTPHGGDITASETWAREDNPHHIVSNVQVMPGATLTLEPGVEVYAQGLFKLKVRGHLEALGTIANPIILQSETTVPGAWDGLEFYGGGTGDEGGTGSLTYVTVRYGGGYGLDGNIRVASVISGSVAMGNTTVKDGLRHGVSTANASVSLTDCHLDDNGTATGFNGLNAGMESEIVVQHSTFNGNFGSGIHTETGSELWMFGGSEFTENGSYPIVTQQHNLPNVMSGNSYFDNDIQRMLIMAPSGGTRMGGDTTLTPENGLDGYEVDGTLVVDAGATLTLEPGTWVRGRNFSRLKIIGHLDAQGSDDAPLMFTSAANTGPGEWDGIEFWGGEGEGTGIIRKAMVRYGGGGGLTANIHLGNVTAGELRIMESEVRDGGRAGIKSLGSRLVISDTRISNNGLATAYPGLIVGGGSVCTVTISTIDNNNGEGVQVWGDPVQFRMTGSHITNNQADGIHVWFGRPTVSIEDTRILDNGEDGIDHSGTGTPVVRFSHFEGNDGLGINNRSTKVCLDAMANYWGATNGPDDPSAAEDGCMGSVSNASTGEGVSDDVKYSRWVGWAPTMTVAAPALGATLVYTDPQQLPTTIQVPAGAMSETTIIVYTPVASPTQPISPNLRFAGHAFDLTTYAGGKPASIPEAPVTVIIYYSAADVEGVDEESLLLYVWNGATWVDAGTTCEPASTYTRNPEANWLSVAICHLSRFGLYGKAAPDSMAYLPLVLRSLP